MERRNFVKLLGFAPILCSPFSWRFLHNSTEELCGLTAPTLKGSQFKLQAAAANAFVQMQTAAAKENIQLASRSSYRSFYFQAKSWNKRVKRQIKQGLSEKQAVKNNLKYVAIPGTSRHHWGTEIDIIDKSVAQPNSGMPISCFEPGGRYYPMHVWLTNNAHKYGFYLVYTHSAKRPGFCYEPWHYSYAPISKKYLTEMLKINFSDLWNQHLIMGKQYFDKGFEQWYKQNYLKGINPLLTF